MRQLSVLVTLLCCVLSMRSVRGDGWADGVVGECSQVSGVDASYSYHFNRNALLDSRVTNRAVIGLTASGNLLRFERFGMDKTGERVDRSKVMCLGSGRRGEILAGLADGQVCRVNAETLALTKLAQVEGEPVWVGEYGGADGVTAKLLVVTKTVVDRDSRRDDLVAYHVFDVESGSRYPVGDHQLAYLGSYPRTLGRAVSTVLLDRQNRLWLGADRGEWGGWCGYIRPDEGKLTVVSDHCDGVYGFAELANGEVWAFGGTSHMGVSCGSIARVDMGSFDVLWEHGTSPGDDNEHVGNTEQKATETPILPITHIVTDPHHSDEVLVFSYGRIFRVDTALKKWTSAGNVEVSYSPGRPDAVGSYPAIVNVHVNDFEKPDLLCATVRNGFVSMKGVEQKNYTVPAQLDCRFVRSIKPSRNGAYFLGWGHSDSPWQLVDGKWATSPVVGKDSRIPWSGWHDYDLLVDSSGEVVTVANLGGSGIVVVTRWQNDRGRVVAYDADAGHLGRAFITPDGQLWSAAYGKLMRLVGQRWERVGSEPGTGWYLKVLNSDGSPWIILDPSEERLWRLAYGEGYSDPKMEEISLANAEGKPLKVFDAAGGDSEEILLATDDGLRMYDCRKNELRPAPFEKPSELVDKLAFDGMGRLWMGGKGLWMYEPKSKRLHSFETLPMIASHDVWAISADPASQEGVIVSFGDGGVAFVRAKSGERRD